MDRRHFRKVQYKAEAALFASMKQWQRRLETTPTGLPPSDVLWRSLRLQLMVMLQKLASKRKLTILEAKQMILRTKPQDLTMEEQCWLESARNLVSIMPPPTESKVKSYNLSSYPPKLIPHRGALPAPSSLTNPTHPSTLTSPNVNPLSAFATPPHPAEVSTSTSSNPRLPSVTDLIHATFQTDLSPTPNSTLPYQLATRHPLSVTPMGPPCTTTRPGNSTESWRRCPTTPHPKTGQTLCLLGSYRTKDLEELTSQSQTCKDAPSSLTTSRL